MVVVFIAFLAVVCGLIGYYRQSTFTSIVYKPDFSGEMMRQYFIYTEIYYIMNLVFSVIGAYMIYDHNPIIAVIGISFCVILAIPRINTVITFTLSQNASKTFNDQAEKLRVMKMRFEDDKCEK